MQSKRHVNIKYKLYLYIYMKYPIISVSYILNKNLKSSLKEKLIF